MDGTATSTAKRALVHNFNQASSGPASRTKRRRIAEGEAKEDGRPDDDKVKQYDKASLPDYYGVHTPPHETSRDEGTLSPKLTAMQPEVHLKDELTPTTDQAGGTALANTDTPRSMSSDKETLVNETSLSALSTGRAHGSPRAGCTSRRALGREPGSNLITEERKQEYATKTGAQQQEVARITAEGIFPLPTFPEADELASPRGSSIGAVIEAIGKQACRLGMG